MRPILPLTAAEAPVASQVLLGVVGDLLGTVPNMYRILANSPAALDAFIGFQTALDRSELPQLIRERIALTVAEAHGSDYCLSAQTHRIRKAHLLDDAEITANRNGASNELRADAALRFVVALLRDGGRLGSTELDLVRRAGYSDAEVIEIIATTALNNFANAINLVLQTEIDFPYVGARKAAA